MRLRTAKHEIMIAVPDADTGPEYVMVVVHETKTV